MELSNMSSRWVGRIVWPHWLDPSRLWGNGCLAGTTPIGATGHWPTPAARISPGKEALTMKINDNGPKPNAFDIETATKENTNYRTTAWTGKYLQVTLMSIPVGESIGLEAHPDTDQFLRLDSGKGRCVMGPAEDQLDFQQDVSDGWSVQVPAGTWHDVINTGDEPMQVYAIYAPVHHTPGIVQETAAKAEEDEKSGADVPPEWSVQPDKTADDLHA
ncbi:cupin domain protein [Propionibacterium sp. CC003-HC2]|nr:cupin domain protein [Propionibacterium sp. CC003-HC2]